jgi:hypothetical protein
MTGLTHRQSEILNIARAFGRVMVEDLARRFEVSAQTIRKDLIDLCDHRLRGAKRRRSSLLALLIIEQVARVSLFSQCSPMRVHSGFLRAR